MSWTWTGYDHDAVHRFKDEKFWQTGRNKAEDRFWQTQIHGDRDQADRRGTMSSISIGSRASPFRSGHTDSQGRHVHGIKYEPRERSNSVMSTLSSRMRQFGPSRDYPYALPGEFSEEEEEEEEEKAVDEANTEEKEEDKKEIKAEEEAKEEKKKASENDDSESVSCSTCSCSEKKKPEKTVGKSKEKDAENKEHAEVKEIPKIQELNLKMNPMKTMITKIDRGNHISSRFY